MWIRGPWRYAGPDWVRAKVTDRVAGVMAAEIQCDDADKLAARWGEIVGQDPVADQAGGPTLGFDNGNVRFVACADGRPEGLGAIDIRCVDRAAMLEAAHARGVAHTADQVTLCGLRINLVD